MLLVCILIWYSGLFRFALLPNQWRKNDSYLFDFTKFSHLNSTDTCEGCAVMCVFILIFLCWRQKQPAFTGMGYTMVNTVNLHCVVCMQVCVLPGQVLMSVNCTFLLLQTTPSHILSQLTEINWAFVSSDDTLTHYYYWSLLYSAILRFRADSLRSHVILHEWIAFYSAFLNIHWSGVLTVLAWLVPHETASISACSVYTIQPCTMSLHAKPHL